MKNRLGKFLICISVILLMTSCISKKEVAFAYLVPIGDMNGSVKLGLWEPDKINNYHLGEEIPLAISNISNYEVSFPFDYGTTILTYNENEGDWIEVSNGIQYDSDSTELARMAIDEQGASFSVLPIVQNNGKPVDIRVVIMGKNADMSIPLNKDVGAYIDITLQP